MVDIPQADPNAQMPMDASMPMDLPNNLNAITDTPVAPVAQKVYQKIGDSRVPVSKSMGPLWKSRRDAGLTHRKPYEDAWDEAIKYYNNNQHDHRTSGVNTNKRSGNVRRRNRNSDEWTETENIVFATVNAIVPAIYAKNPEAEFTPNIATTPGEAPSSLAEELKEFAECCEKLINTLAYMPEAPGFFMKIKAKQAVINAQLTNESWIEYGYTIKDLSSETANQQMLALATAYETAKDEQELIRIEGDMMAIEEKIDALSPEGPFARFRSGKEVVVDPDSMCPLHSDANWIMYQHMFSTAYLNAVYRTRDETGVVKSLYEPTHVVQADDGASEIENTVNNFKLFDTSKSDGVAYGYNDGDAFRRAQRTLCWVVWDKITRRVYLFSDKDWKWPIWVWDDPYKLPGFFPLEKLSFVTPPVGARAIGETSYYLDQQDAINDGNSELHRIRHWAKSNYFFNTNVLSKDDFEAYIKGPDGTARGIAVPEGHKLTDHIYTLVPPSVQYAQMFDSAPKIAAIDRITGTSVIMRNEQFKTNTTNEAINAYNGANQTRLDDKIDTTEDWIGRIYRGITMLCVQFMSKDMVVGLIGEDRGAAFKNMLPREFTATMPCRIVGGSTQKPTSAAKKKEATAMGQVLGQFVNAAPGPVLEVMLRMLEKAFDEINITSEDWEYIRTTALQQLDRGNSVQGGGGGGNPAEGGGGGAPGNAPSPGQDILSVLDSLPPQAKAAFATALSRGASARETFAQIMGALQQQSKAA